MQLPIINKVLPKPSDCFLPQPCPLASIDPNGFSQPIGSGVNKVMIIGEALGANERRDGKPFREDAEAGGLLERIINKGGWSREQFSLWNVLGCQPTNNKLAGEWYEQQAIDHCKVHFDRVITRFNPSVILALGNIPLRTLTGFAGEKQGISLLRGFVLPGTRYPVPVVPSFHPSYINRGNKHLTGVSIRDMGLAIDVAKSSFGAEVEWQKEKDLQEKGYILHPSIDEARSWALRALESGKALAVDIETNYSLVNENEDEYESNLIGQQITQIQFSTDPYTGIVFPWTTPYIPIARMLLESELEKWGHNYHNFDKIVLKNHGIETRGVIHDIMDAWHHLQPDLPRNLQFVTSFYAPYIGPWKHLSNSDPALYGCKDVDAPIRNGQGIFRDLRVRGLFDSYIKYYVRYQPILESTANRGIPIDRDKQAEFKLRLEAKMEKIDLEIQPLIPQDILPIHPKSTKVKQGGYRKEPQDIKALRVALWVDDGEDIPSQETVDNFRIQASKLGYKAEWFEPEAKDQASPWLLKETYPGSIKGRIQRWVKLLSFNANSSSQLINYIKFMGSEASGLSIAKRKLYKVPTKRVTGADTVEEEQLSRLFKKTNDKVLGLALGRKKMSHFVSSFCTPEWTPGSDGRVHTTFKGGGTAIMQLSAEKPNILQFPKHGPLAQEARRFIVAPPGFKIVTHDFKAFHAQTGSCEAGDAKYLRLSKLDIHSYVTAQFLHVPGRELFLKLNDEDLLKTLGELKKDPSFKFVRDAKAKHAILGINNGMGSNKLYDKYQESFENLAEAKKLQAMLRVEFPDFFQWQNDVRKLAHQQGFLKSKFDCIRYFWEVFTKRNGQWVSGESSEECIAYLLSNHAHCHMRSRVIEMDDKGLLERYGLVNIIHDEVFMVCLDELVEECLLEIPKIMSRPSEVMIHPIVAPNGLSIEVDSSVGSNWAAYHAERNPLGMRSYPFE